MIKKDNNVFYSNNDIAKKEIDRVKKNNKDYNLIINGLFLLGKFNDKIEVNIYDIINDDNDKEVILYCEDKEGSIFTFRSFSSKKDKIKRVMKISDISEIEYDFSLVKKHILTIDNIELTRTGKIFDFKYGRLITDEKTFYSIFLSGNVCHQIIIDVDTPITNMILYKLNKLEREPSLNIFIKIIQGSLSESIKSCVVRSYKDFYKIIDINNDNKDDKKLQLIRNQNP